MAFPDEGKYRCLVVDSGPIIRGTAQHTLWNKASQYVTVPAVLQEIRDAKARSVLETMLPLDDLKIREASSEGINKMTEFARKTGDYPSLSVVDLQVLGLLYDLEKEGCLDMDHVRTSPKRVVGLGKMEMMGKGGSNEGEAKDGGELEIVEDDDDSEADVCFDDDEEAKIDDAPQPVSEQQETQQKPKSWAMLVNPQEASESLPETTSRSTPDLVEQAATVHFGKMNLLGPVASIFTNGGQFSDAEDDDDLDFDIQQPVSQGGKAAVEELKEAFPSLAAAATVPYEGTDDDENDAATEEPSNLSADEEARRKASEERKQAALKPLTKSGKLYNPFRSYGDLMKPSPKKKPVKASKEETICVSSSAAAQEETTLPSTKSHILCGMSFAGQEADIEDDGEGWITTTKDIRTMKAAGALDPKRSPAEASGANLNVAPLGPPNSQRTACATTDFAMQNVILQMNLELLSVDGVKVRKLKSWVTRCGACYKVYTSSENVGPTGTKRLFCDHCGSDMMQRIAASVDGKTGRLRLHLSKKYRHNLRGTKFSLPKPGTNNRFQGDLLLREDQLLTGAWNQKVKMRSGGKAKSSAQSIFGRDIATSVGCHASSLDGDGIRVGFGRRNPNAAKGRERRGKKKKSSDKACGLRRY